MKKAITLLTLIALHSLVGGNLELREMLLNSKGWSTYRNGKIALANENDTLKITIPCQVTITCPTSYTAKFKETFNDKKGIGFKVKCEGGKHFLPVRLGIFSEHTRYYVYIPVTGGKWNKIKIAWSDFISTDFAQHKIGTPSGLEISMVQSITFGDNWQITYANKKIPQTTYFIRDLCLLDKVKPQYVPQKATTPPIATVVKKMKSGKKVLIYCHGDSITAGTGVGENRYANLLQEKLRTHYHNPNITIKTIAVGGATSNDLRIWAEKDFANLIKPDLVTICIGANDVIQTYPPYIFKNSMNDFIERLITHTKGNTSLLLIPTLPGKSNYKHLMERHANAIREISGERNLAFCDLPKIFFELSPENFDSFFLDSFHPNKKGHEFIAEKLFKYLEQF